MICVSRSQKVLNVQCPLHTGITIAYVILTSWYFLLSFSVDKFIFFQNHETTGLYSTDNVGLDIFVAIPFLLVFNEIISSRN